MQVAVQRRSRRNGHEGLGVALWFGREVIVFEVVFPLNEHGRVRGGGCEVQIEVEGRFVEFQMESG